MREPVPEPLPEPSSEAVAEPVTGASRAFSAVTAVRPDGAGSTPGSVRFAADIHPEWTIGGKPNGGYLLAMLARAASGVAAHPHPIAASGTYLRAPNPGPAVIEVELLRSGRSASQLRARLHQEGTPCLESLQTFAALDPDAEPYWAGGVPDPGTEEFERAFRLPSTNPSGTTVAIMDVVDLRVERGTMGFARGVPSGTGELRGWLSLLDGEQFDPFSLLYAVDALVPATFEVEVTGWVPTLELTAYVRALPAPGPLRVTQRAHLVDAQRVDESCWVWDSRGRLVAQAVQLAGIRLG